MFGKKNSKKVAATDPVAPMPLQAGQLNLRIGQLVTIDGFWLKIVGLQPTSRTVVMQAMTPNELMAEEAAQKARDEQLRRAVEGKPVVEVNRRKKP